MHEKKISPNDITTFKHTIYRLEFFFLFCGTRCFILPTLEVYGGILLAFIISCFSFIQVVCVDSPTECVCAPCVVMLITGV